MCRPNNKKHTHFQQWFGDTHFCQTKLRHPKRYALFKHNLLHNGWRSLYALLPARKSITFCKFWYQIRKTSIKLAVMHHCLSTLDIWCYALSIVPLIPTGSSPYSFCPYLHYRLNRAFSVVGPSTWNGLLSELRLFPRTCSPAFFFHLKAAVSSRVGVGSASE